MRAKTIFTPTLSMRQRGFSLMEALIALAVIGFGFLAVARFQMSVFENGDFARQRSEATRLARDRIEQIRGFEQIASEPGKLAYNDYAATAAYPATTASQTLPAPQQELIESPYAAYTSRWWITPGTGGNLTMLTVEVSWPNRQGQAESVTLQSVMAKAEPKESLGIRFPAAGSPVKKPLDRNLNVPVPAVSLSGNKSGFTPPGATGFYYVFDNASGIVTNICAGNLPSAGSQGCTNNSTSALVISGYVNFRMGQPCANVFDTNCSPDNAMNVNMEVVLNCPDGTSLPDSSSCSYPNLPNETKPYKCTASSAAGSNPVTYTCVVTTHDLGEGNKPRYVWAGQVKLGSTIGTGTIGTGNNQYKVCRYSDDYDMSGTTGDINAEHPLIYGLIGSGKPGYMSESQENQNFLVIEGNRDCPTQTGYKTVQHQP